ncbi:hypothetical protein ACTQ6A_13955 [Lachnospiraceae bacterium LCP25S3_G4]
MPKYQGTGVVTSNDFKKVKFVATTKNKTPITISLENAINMGNIEWTFADKDDVVAEIVFTAVYDNTDSASTTTKEPWTIEVNGSLVNVNDAIMTNAGILYIEETPIALSRGGGKFLVEREYREINADGDRGPVKGRISMDASRASLTLNTLEIITSLSNLYPAIETVTVPGA